MHSERFGLIFWTDKDTLSAVPREQVMEDVIEVGSSFTVNQGRRKYRGKMAAVRKCCSTVLY